MSSNAFKENNNHAVKVGKKETQQMKQNWIDTSVLDSTQAAQYIKARHKERGNAHHGLPRRPDSQPDGQHHGDAQQT